jgi:hypothetical protein
MKNPPGGGFLAWWRSYLRPLDLIRDIAVPTSAAMTDAGPGELVLTRACALSPREQGAPGLSADRNPP